MSPSFSRSSTAQARLAAIFPSASDEVLSMPGTVYADHDEVKGKLVFGISNANAAAGIRRSLEARGLAASEFEIVSAQPIEMMNLQTTRYRPSQAGGQIHFGGYVCTLGFNVTHSGGRSFITNSHCTNKQGGVEGTTYALPVRANSSDVDATEVADPTYSSSGCSAGKVCRFSDASRAVYVDSIQSTQGLVHKPLSMNTGNLNVSGSFTITEQNNTATTYAGTIHKVGRTTGWTSGTVSGTCVNVNVQGSKIQQKCQTLVTNNNAAIVGGGDSGSPVFQIISGDNVRLVGILWGGGGSTQFVFSPLKNVQDELGSIDALFGGGGGGGGGGEEPPEEPPCVPKGPNGNNCK
jgi:hypothetical protein